MTSSARLPLVRAAFAAAMTLACVLAFAWTALGTAAAQAPASWYGTWRVNLEKSRYPAAPPAFKRMTCTIEPWDADGLKVTYDLIRQRGGVTHLEWTGRFDGKDYPVQGVDDVVTNAYRRIDDHTFEVVQKVDGQVVATARATVSADGKTLTTVTPATNALGQDVGAITVYEKQ